MILRVCLSCSRSYSDSPGYSNSFMLLRGSKAINCVSWVRSCSVSLGRCSGVGCICFCKAGSVLMVAKRRNIPTWEKAAETIMNPPETFQGPRGCWEALGFALAGEIGIYILWKLPKKLPKFSLQAKNGYRNAAGCARTSTCVV